MVEVSRKRNIAIVGQHGAGKTSLIEAILYNTGVVKQLGKVDAGTTFADYLDEEKSSKHTLASKVFHCTYKGNELHLIDTPGYSDFVGDIHDAIHAADGVLLVVNAQSGVEVETIKIWEYLEELHIPRLVVVNKMDMERADFGMCLDSLEAGLEAKICPVRLPLGKEKDFKGVIDLITDKVLLFDDKGNAVKEEEIPQDIFDEVEEFRKKMVEASVTADEALMERYLNDEKLEYDEIRHGLHDGVLSGETIPVFVTDAVHCTGISSLLDGLVNYIPKPEERGTFTAVKKDSNEEFEEPIALDGPGIGFVFKSMIDPFAGKIAYVHVISGTISSDSEIHIRNKDQKVKVSHLQSVNGKKLSNIQSATVGDIIAITKVDELDTNDTISTAPGDVLVAPTHIPQPPIYMAIHAANQKDEDKLGSALHKLVSGDPSIHVERNAETKENVINASGKMQLDLLIQRLRSQYNIEVELTTPKVAYRETITRKGEGRYRHKKQSGGHGQFAEVQLRLKPLERGNEFEFINNIFGGAVPTKFVPAVEKGVQDAFHKGVLAGYPMVDVSVELFDGQFHDVDSSEMAFKIASSMCIRQVVMENCAPILLEPIMNVSILVQEESMGDVMGDLNTRRGRVQGMDTGGNKKQVIRAQVPLAEMYTYAINLRSITKGLGSFEMEFSHYEQVPHDITEKVVALNKKEHTDEG